MCIKYFKLIKIFDLPQWNHDLLIKLPCHGPARKVLFHILLALRNLLLSFSEPIVSHKLGMYTIKVPLSHDLAINQKFFPVLSGAFRALSV